MQSTCFAATAGEYVQIVVSLDMPTSPAAARRRALGLLIVERGAIRVSETARELGVSDMTIRRDLEALERGGVVERSHGGAVPAAAVQQAEPSFASRARIRAAAKQAIALAAASLVGDHEVVGLDVGSTVACLARELGRRSGLCLVTNSLQAVLAMTQPVLADVHVLGGQLRPREGSLCGRVACDQLREHWLSTVFLGVAGLDETGLHDYTPAETDVKLAMVDRASRVIVVADSGKIGRRSFVRFCDLRRIAALVTDAPVPHAMAAALADAGSAVIVARAEAGAAGRCA